MALPSIERLTNAPIWQCLRQCDWWTCIDQRVLCRYPRHVDSRTFSELSGTANFSESSCLSTAIGVSAAISSRTLAPEMGLTMILSDILC